MEVVEKDVVNHKPGEGVENASDYGKTCILHKAFNIKIGSERSKTEFKHEQRGHQIRQPCRGEGKCQPKERAEEKIEAIGGDKICAEIGLPVPEKTAASDSTVSQLIKRNLLDVVVTIVYKQSFTKNKGGNKYNGSHAEGDYKSLPVSFFMKSQVVIIHCKVVLSIATKYRKICYGKKKAINIYYYVPIIPQIAAFLNTITVNFIFLKKSLRCKAENFAP